MANATFPGIQAAAHPHDGIVRARNADADADLMNEDLTAGRTVSMILLGIVMMGLAGMILTVLLSLGV